MDAQLKRLVLQYGGSILGALLELAELETSAELADKLGIERRVMEEALQPFRDRTYAHIRRSIEAQMNLSQYLLDELLPPQQEE